MGISLVGVPEAPPSPAWLTLAQVWGGTMQLFLRSPELLSPVDQHQPTFTGHLHAGPQCHCPRAVTIDVKMFKNRIYVSV